MYVVPRLAIVGMVTSLSLCSLLAASASGQGPSKFGWWNTVTANGVALPQPTTSADALHVGQGPKGPSAYAAVAYDLPGVMVTSAVIQLKVVAQSTVGQIVLAACPTKDLVWKTGGDQPIDTAPEYDCTKGVGGLVSADGTTVTFPLDSQQQLATGGYSLAIVPDPGAAPFSVDFSKPDDKTLTVQADAAPAAAAPPPGPAPFGTPSGEQASAPPSSGASTIIAGPAGLVPLAPVLAAPPAIEQPSVGMPAAPTHLAARPDLVPTGNRERYLAGSILALLAGALVWAYQQPTPAPRRLGGLARKSAPAATSLPAGTVGPIRGIGRFAIARSEPARRLI